MKTLLLFLPKAYLWQISNKKLHLIISGLVKLILICIISSSCNPGNNTKYKKQNFKADFKRIDDFHKAGNLKQVSISLDSLKPLLHASDIENLTHYYIFRSQTVFPNKNLMNVYADSLLNLFESEEPKIRYKQNYIRALILKSDVFLYFKQYDKTLEQYFKVSLLLDKKNDPANYSDFIGKIGQIYYLQGKFATAAKYQIDAYNAIQQAKDVNPTNLFYITQGALNNAGFSYERAEKLDSALHFYKKNLAYILNQEKKNDVSHAQVMSAKIVALDNIGGLYGKTGNFKLARAYLEECIAINNHSLETSKVPAFIKLAKVLSNTGYAKKADSILVIT
ncbi:MAG: tetratricopeptide repeat protein, partial [Pedobacter sp.]